MGKPVGEPHEDRDGDRVRNRERGAAGLGATQLAFWLAFSGVVGTGCGSETAGTPDQNPADILHPEATGDFAFSAEVPAADDANPSDRDASEDAPSSPFALTVMTFNVMCSFCGGSEYDPWEDRIRYQADLIRRHAPDLIGLQELTFAEEVNEYLALNPDYEAVYYISDDPDAMLPAYPDQTILYRKGRFDVVDSGFFWLSPTPDQPFSVGFSDGGQLPRLVGFVLFEQKADGRRFYFANTHFDPNHPSQEKSVPLVYDRLSSLVSQHPLIFTGDFNLDPGEDGFVALTSGVPGHDWHFTLAYDIADERVVVTNLADPSTLNDRGRGIDLILFAGAEFECPFWKVDYTTYGESGRFPSDHFAISARLVESSPRNR